MGKEVEIIDGVELSVDKKKTPKQESIARNERRAKQSPSHVKSIMEPTYDDAKEMLAAEGQLHHPRAIDVAVRLAKLAARANKLPFNAHLVSNALQNTLSTL